MLAAAREAGATRAFYQVLRLPWEVAPLFRQWLVRHYPQRAQRVMARVQELHGGRDYDASFATRMKGRGPWADLLSQRFGLAMRRLDYERGALPHDLSRFRRPAPVGQLPLF